MFRRWRFELPAALEDSLSAELWDCGCTGLEVGPVGGFGLPATIEGAPADKSLLLDAWFSEPLSDLAREFDFSGWAARQVSLVRSEMIPEQDWLAHYRASAQPFDVGHCFRIDPRGTQAVEMCGVPHRAPSSPDDRRTLLIPAQTAFGTGSHESTRLAICLLEEAPPVGCRVLDVGTGSGILALVCEHLGAARVIGFDLDPAAPLVARQNTAINRGSCSFFAGTASALRSRALFDYLLVNVLPERIVEDLAFLVSLLQPGGRLISSGNLLERRQEIIDRFAALGLAPIREQIDGEWVAFVLEKCPLSS